MERVVMTTKQKILDVVRSLPVDATIEDAMERILFLAKMERGIGQADAGKTLPHDKVRKRMAKGLKGGCRVVREIKRAERLADRRKTRSLEQVFGKPRRS